MAPVPCAAGVEELPEDLRQHVCLPVCHKVVHNAVHMYRVSRDRGEIVEGSQAPDTAYNPMVVPEMDFH